MGGGLMQLVAYGAQDAYLTGNPQITFFKIVYRRHTNFACEVFEQDFNGKPEFGGKANVPITRNGDLVTKMWLKTDVKSSDTMAKVVTTPFTTQTFVLRPSTLVVTGGSSGVANLSFSNSGFGEITITADAGDQFTNASFGKGQVVQISETNNYNGYYLVNNLTGDKNTTKLVALATNSTDSNGTETTGIFHNNYGSPDDENTDTNAKVTLYGNAETFSYVNDLGYALIDSVELQIGGTRIDKHYGRWMHIWSQLTKTYDQNPFYTDCINSHHDEWGDTNTPRTLYVPLQFFCCRHDGLALPLISLQYHDVRLEFEFATKNACCVSNTYENNISLDNTCLLVNYIYLDSEERKRFSQASHEYLIEQLQFTGAESVSTGSNKIILNFNHPVKELVWVVQNDTTGRSKLTKFTDDDNHNPITKSLLQLNGHDRFAEQDGSYFNRVQPNQHHTRQPSDGINLYSFALNPEEHQPSGTCNFSRIDNAILSVTVAANSGTKLYVYGVNYNVLRIMSGMGGVAYSN